MRSEYILKKDQALPPWQQLDFGKYYVPYMYLRRFHHCMWETRNLIDYQLLEMDPGANVLHYGQAIFEGMKAYYNQDQDKYYLFRPEENARRYQESARRLCMPELPIVDFMESVFTMTIASKSWIPSYSKNSPTLASLYIRPFMIGTSPKLGVKPSEDYAHLVITSPSGPYFPTGLKPIKLRVETDYVRATPGGTGNVKVAGNYASSLFAGSAAKNAGYAQVLWLDALEHRYLEEVGAMNVFVVIKDELHTPALTGSILPGITRKSIIELAQQHFKINVVERQLPIDEIISGIEDGSVTEIFGSGTAAVVTPVGLLGYKDRDVVLSMEKIGPITRQLYDTLIGIQYGEVETEVSKSWATAVTM